MDNILDKLPPAFWLSLAAAGVTIYLYRDILGQLPKLKNAGESINDSLGFTGRDSTLGTSLFDVTHDEYGRLDLLPEFEILNYSFETGAKAGEAIRNTVIDQSRDNAIYSAVNETAFPDGKNTFGTWLYEVTH